MSSPERSVIPESRRHMEGKSRTLNCKILHTSTLCCWHAFSLYKAVIAEVKTIKGIKTDHSFKVDR